MKPLAYHDLEGNIKHIVTLDAPEHVGMMLAPEAGLFVTEIEGFKFKSKKPSIEELHEIKKNYKISSPKIKGRIEKKIK